MSLASELDIPETGAVFTFGKSHFADNEPSHFFIKNDPVTFIACGDEHTTVICQQGRVFGFGANSHGQLGLGHTNTVERPACLKWLKPRKAKQIACGRGHTIILTEDNQLFASGDNSEGQLGTGCKEPQLVPQYVEINGEEDSSVIQMTCGAEHTIVLFDSGRAYSCGSNSDGQLGLGENVKSSLSFQLIPFEYNIRYIASGYYNSIFIADTGDAFACGENDNQYLGTPSVLMRIFEPEMVSMEGLNVIAASSGANHSFFVVEGGTVYAVGSNARGQLGLPKTIEDETRPKKIAEKLFSGRKIAKVACGSMHTAFVTTDGYMYTCGDSSHQKLCLDSDDIGNNNIENTDSHSNQFLPTLVTVLEGFNIDNVACGGCHTILSATKDPLYENNNLDPENPEYTNSTMLGELPPLQKVPVSILNRDSSSYEPGEESGMNGDQELHYAESSVITDETIKETSKRTPVEITEDDGDDADEDNLEMNGEVNAKINTEVNAEINSAENPEGNIERMSGDNSEEIMDMDSPRRLVGVLTTSYDNIEEMEIEKADDIDESKMDFIDNAEKLLPMESINEESIGYTSVDIADRQSINSLEPNVSGSHILRINEMECSTVMPVSVVDIEQNEQILLNLKAHKTTIEQINTEGVEEMYIKTHKLPIKAIEMVTPIETRMADEIQDISTVNECVEQNIDTLRNNVRLENIGTQIKPSLLNVPETQQHSPAMSAKSECSQKSMKSSTGSRKSENETIICHSDKSSPQMSKLSKTQAVIPILRSEDSTTMVDQLIDDETDIVQSKISKTIENEGKISKFFHGSCMGKTRVLSSVDVKEDGTDAADSSIQLADQTNSKTCVIL